MRILCFFTLMFLIIATASADLDAERQILLYKAWIQELEANGDYEQSNFIKKKLEQFQVETAKAIEQTNSNHQTIDSQLKSYEDRYDQIIQKYAIAEKVSPYLIKAVIKAESNFNPYAIGIGVKDQRSYGLMQLNAVNFQRLGLNTKTVFEPDKNIEAGCKILSENLKRFNGDLRKALIAYVAGSGNVSKIIRSLDQGKCVSEEILIYLDNVATAYKRYRRQQTFSRR